MATQQEICKFNDLMETNDVFPKSLEALKNLIIRYETITLKEIQEIQEIQRKECIDETLKSILTGFGATDTCTVCKSTASDMDRARCEYCISNIKKGYFPSTGCSETPQLVKSFYSIAYANTPRKLYYAYNQRAIALREYLAEFGVTNF